MRRTRPQSLSPAQIPAFRSGLHAGAIALRLAVAATFLNSANYAAAQQRVLGIDVSAWQVELSTANWATFKRPTTQQVDGIPGDGRDFVFIRSSRGGTTGYYDQSDADNSNGLNELSQRYDDPYFVQNITRATAAGMFAGPYHFSRPDVIATTENSDGIANTGLDEANHFLQMAGPWMRPGYLLPVHDFEAGDGARTDNEMAQFVIDFTSRIYEVTGVRPFIYANGNYAEFIIGGASASLRNRIVSENLLWTARWPNQTDPNYIPAQTEHPKDSYTPIYGPWDDAPNPTHPWRFWQYSSRQRLWGLNNRGSNIDANVAQGGLEFVKDHLVPALWVSGASGNWGTMANWNSGQVPTAPVQGPDQVPRVGPMTLPATRLPTNIDTVVLEHPTAAITVTVSSGTHTIRKLYAREALNLTGGSLTVGYVPSADSTPIAAQFSAPVTLGNSGSLSVHTLQVDAAQTFSVGTGTLTFTTIQLMPHATTPAKLLLTANPNFIGLAAGRATITNGAGTGNSGIIDLGGVGRTWDVPNMTSGIDVAVDVPITNGSLTKQGAGSLSLNAANTYTGTTTVQAGRLELSGSLNAGVTVSGGSFALGTGTANRTVHGSLLVSSGGTFRARINGPTLATEYDRLTLTNPGSVVALAGALDLAAPAALAAGTTFRIIDNIASNSAVIGNFIGLPQDAEFIEDNQWWRISYTGGTGNDVVLTRVAATPYHAWKQTHFPANVNDQTVVGDLVDIEKDGLANLLEYAFGGNPNLASQSQTPKSSVVGNNLAITFNRVVANNDITLIVQASSSLEGPWTDLASSVAGAATTPLVAGVSVTETGTGANRTVQVRDHIQITDPLHAQRILKVKVTRP